MNQDLGLGQIFAKDDKFTIYSIGTENTGMYFACVPNELKDSSKTFVDLHKKSDLSMYIEVNDSFKRQELVTKLKEVNNFVNGMNNSGIYVMPMIDVASVENLDEKSKNEEFDRVFKMIAGCTNDINKKLKDSSNGQKTIDQVITIIEQTESDKQFVEWLGKIGYSKFVLGVTLDDLRKQYQVEQQMVNSSVVPNNLNVDAIEKSIISDTISPVQSNVSVSNDNIVSMAQNNIQNGNTVLGLQKNDSIISQIENSAIQSEKVPTNDNIEQSMSQVQQNFEQQPVMNSTEPIKQAPIVSINSSSIAPIDRSLDNVAYQNENLNTLVRKPDSKLGNIARAGFVKFPVFLLTIMAIGAFGIFVGKMFYAYLSQQ